MSNNNGFKAFLVIIGSLVFIGIFIGLAIDSMFHSDITVGQEVGMCQPGGWNLDRDYRCAEVNVLNSSANVNNGEAHLYNAKATAVIQEARVRRIARLLSIGGMSFVPSLRWLRVLPKPAIRNNCLTK
jgi:hypothetical protein